MTLKTTNVDIGEYVSDRLPDLMVDVKNSPSSVKFRYQQILVRFRKESSSGFKLVSFLLFSNHIK